MTFNLRKNENNLPKNIININRKKKETYIRLELQITKSHNHKICH